MFDFLRIAIATPEIKVADCDYNAEKIIALLREARAKKTDVIVFPELCVTAYSCADLFFQSSLLDSAERAVEKIRAATEGSGILAAVGLPTRAGSFLFNACAVASAGKILGVVPKTHLPNYEEYYEKRWFSPSFAADKKEITLCGQIVPFGADLIFTCGKVEIGIEICEDLWTVNPPSSELALNGANILLNLSASNELLGKDAIRKEYVKSQSMRTVSVYAYANAGPSESTADAVFSGSGFIYENGVLLAENKKFARGSQLTVCDADVELLIKERVKRGHNPQKPAAAARKIEFNISGEKSDLLRIVPPLPFVSARKTKLDQNCEDTMNIQCAGLAKRLLHTGSKTAVIGISGGLDSTLALLITARTFDMLEKPRKDIIAVTMPGFGTSGRTFENSRALMKEFKVTAREIPISKSVALHLEDIGHSPEARDATYENAQARERTQILMDLANKERGIVIGTGDLSEIALGWSTYNGDHMSMYSVNCGVPKTFIRSLIDWIVNFTDYGENAKRLLNDVLNTPVSPELLPPDEKGDIGQKTEEIVGPYELTDFFLYYAQRYGFSPAKIVFLARNAFGEKYSRKTIVKFLKEFYKRFFASQFKRSCMPDGPKVGRVALSPRADWRAPSDASGAVWLKELDFLCRLD